MLKTFLHTENDFGPTIARLFAGVVMFPHGAQKALGWFGGNGFSGTVDFMTQNLGLPWIAAVLVILGEFLGSLGLIVGAGTRLAAFGFVSIMTGAIFIAHWKHGFFMNWYGNQQGEGFEYHLLMIGLALIALVKGGGALSVDRVIEDKL